MTPEDFQRVEFLFNAAITQPHDQRTIFLETSESDPHIRAVVTRMLTHAQATDPHPLEAKLRQIASSSAQVPERIGGYRLLRQIGEGGMGSVFLAERDVGGVRQRVALKLLHGFAADAGKRRMARERELLAGMHHPHIAALIDSGETESGRPFLVMDYVEGMGLPEYLEQRKPTLAECLRLYLKCCDAVQHAHQHLVLHRDVKPANIIVHADGTPVLLDFGIGKMLEEAETGSHGATLAFTPGYAAPEQMHGEMATTATDVFGLGALLFDVLTGLRLSSLRKGDMPVPLPSSQTPDSVRRRELRGDLDRIVIKATAQAPEQRYRTAAALADDVQRYLRGEPVAAAPDSFPYRLRKFVGRHRWAVTAGLAAVLVAGIFVWRLDAERQRALQAESAAEREADSASASRDFLVSVLAASDPQSGRGQPITVAALLSAATAKLRSDRGQSDATRAIAWLTIAEVHKSINDPKPGLQAVNTAAALLKRANHADPELQARVLEAKGVLLGQLERLPEAKLALQNLIASRARQGSDAMTMARAYKEYAAVAVLDGDDWQAERSLQSALALLAPDAGRAAGRIRLGILLDLVSMHAGRPGDQAAYSYLARAMKTARTTLEADDPQWHQVHHAACLVYRGLGRYPEALRHAEQALVIARRVYGDGSQHTADQESELAMVLGQLGRYREAVAHLERAQTMQRSLGLGDLVLAQQDILLAWMYEGRGDDARAIALLDSTLARLPENDPAYVSWRWVAYKQRASSHGDLRQFAQAWPDFERALQLVRADRGDESLEYSQVQARYAQVLIDAGRLMQAETALGIAKRLSHARNAAAYIPIWVRLAELEAQLAQARGDAAAAKRQMDIALALAAKDRNTDPVKIGKVKLLAAELAYRQRDFGRANAMLRDAMPALEREMSPQAPQLLKARHLGERVAD